MKKLRRRSLVYFVLTVPLTYVFLRLLQVIIFSKLSSISKYYSFLLVLVFINIVYAIKIGLQHLAESKALLMDQQMRRLALAKRHPIEDKYPGLSVLGVLQQKRTELSIDISVILTFGLIGNAAFGKFQQHAAPLGVPVILFGLIIISLLSRFLYSYRVGKGYYGNNAYEARELIQFILDESENLSSPGGGTRKILSKDDLEQLRAQVALQVGIAPTMEG